MKIIISESQFTEQFGIISEKTFNAIVAGHPFLMCGHQHALENIRHYGFVTYNYLFDEAYDDLDNVRIHYLWEEHKSGKRNWSAKLWNILMYLSWADEFRNNQ